MIACWECRNLTEFTQVSTRSDARHLVSRPTGLDIGAFTSVDDRPPGVYCSKCGAPVEADVVALGLEDRRLRFMAPHEVEVERLADEMVAIRSDADWATLELAPQEPAFGALPAGLHPGVVAALHRTGRASLYSHQCAAIEAGLAGQHVVLATPAGSGKSLGLLAPVLSALATDPTATAIVIFPLKALANDQMNALARLGIASDPWASTSQLTLELGEGAAPIVVGRFDGSTPQHERKQIKASARLLVTTPDMLHVGVLPKVLAEKHRDFRQFFGGLGHVVLDELHTYQGVFGSNVAQVLRRLRRLAHHVGKNPQFLTASATIGNPVALAEHLTGVGPFVLVDNDGSRRARRKVLICNPPERGDESVRAQTTKKRRGREPAEGGRIAPQTVAIELVAHGALASGEHAPVRTIVFARARQTVFQTAQRLKNQLKEMHRGDLVDTVAPYAATFLADDREEAEEQLRDGSTLAIVSTSALELGIDIPDLSLAVLVGYPGQVSSFRQRAGRVGRAGEGVAVLIVGDDPLQQYLARHPEALDALLHGRAEDVVISTSVPEIVRRFGLIPAMEDTGGLSFEDRQFFGEMVDSFLAEASGPPSRQVGGWDAWTVPFLGDSYPGLRSGSPSASYTVMSQTGRDFTAIGTIDETSAVRDCFVPAVWAGPNGDTYVVTGRDEKKREIYCGPMTELPYLTRGVPVDNVHINGEVEGVDFHGASVGYAAMSISRYVPSYREVHHSGVEITRDTESSWPPIDFQTDGVVIRLPVGWFNEISRDHSVKALEHILLSVAPVVVACDPADLETTRSGSTIYLYDSFGGGLRLSEPAFTRLDELVALAREIVASCPCENGCPSCVMLPRRPDGNSELSKQGALFLLNQLNGGT